jgi:hypothetical protein
LRWNWGKPANLRGRGFLRTARLRGRHRDGPGEGGLDRQGWGKGRLNGCWGWGCGL